MIVKGKSLGIPFLRMSGCFLFGEKDSQNGDCRLKKRRSNDWEHPFGDAFVPVA